MKFAAFALLVSSTQAAVHDACTDTWPGAGATACKVADGDPEQVCQDWQAEDKKSSLGLFCGLKTTCDATEIQKFGDDPDTIKYWPVCKGLSQEKCKGNEGVCDKLAGFVCADWTKTDSDPVIGCARKVGECDAESTGGFKVDCDGFLGNACGADKLCNADAGYKCGVEFNNATLSFIDGKNPVCVVSDACGKAAPKTEVEDDPKPAAATNIILCYNEPTVACTKDKPCVKADADADGAVVCAYVGNGKDGANMTGNDTGMCMNKTWCPAGALDGTGASVKYFGKDTKLWCGSARTALAMGAAAVSAYLAM